MGNNSYKNNTKKDKIEIKTMGELENGDMILGTDNNWHKIEIQNIHLPIKMYRIYFKDSLNSNFKILGFIDCSYSHEWTFFTLDSEGFEIKTTFNTETIAEKPEFKFLRNYHVGSINGPYIHNIIEIETKDSRCILVKNSSDHLFNVFMDVDKNQKNKNKEEKEKVEKLERDFERKFSLI